MESICTQGGLLAEFELDRSTFIFRCKFFLSVASPNTDSGIKSFCLHLRDCRFAWSLSARRAVSLPNFSSIRALSFFGPNFFCVAFPNTESRIKSFCLHLRDCRFAWSLSARRAVSVPNLSPIGALLFFGRNFFCVAFPNTESGIKSFRVHLRGIPLAWCLSARRTVSVPNFSSIGALSFFGRNFF